MKNADITVLKEAFEALSKSAAMVAAALRAESAADAEAKPQPKEEKLSAEKVRGMLAAKSRWGLQGRGEADSKPFRQKFHSYLARGLSSGSRRAQQAYRKGGGQ